MHTGKEFLEKVGMRVEAVVPEDQENKQKDPFDHDSLIIQPELMALHNEAYWETAECL